MRTLKKLWHDECGAVMTAELVLLGSMGVVGATVGLNALSNSINEELVDVAKAIRSLDQSYTIQGLSGCGAWTAGSCYQQEPVAESLKKLDLHLVPVPDQKVEEAEKPDAEHQSASSAGPQLDFRQVEILRGPEA